MKKKIRLIFIINTITSYQMNFFNFIKRYFSIKVLFYSKKYKNYEFSYRKKNFFFIIEDQKDKFNFINKTISNFKPHFFIIGGYKLEYINYIIKFLKKNKIRYFFWLERLNEKKKIKLKIIHYFFKYRLKVANGIFAIGNQAFNFYKKYNQNILNLPYSIKINRLNRRGYYKNHKINFLFVGQLIERKGVDLILKVINNLNPEIQKKTFFTIVGNGELSEEVEILEKNKENIKYYKFQNIDKLNKLYLRNDVLMFPSRYDGWGVAPMEAMCNSMLIIISKNCGVCEIVKKNKGNLIIDSKMKDLESAILKCVKDKNIVKKFGPANRNLMLDSICNLKNSSKLLVKYLNKYDNRN